MMHQSTKFQHNRAAQSITMVELLMIKRISQVQLSPAPKSWVFLKGDRWGNVLVIFRTGPES